MPQMGESIFEGTITKWLKKSATPCSATSHSLKSPPTKWMPKFPPPQQACSRKSRFLRLTVQINTVVAVLGGSNGKAAPVPAATAPVATTSAAPTAATAQPTSEAPESVSQDGVRSSPLVRRIAKENNLDLRKVRDPAPAGRITKEDVLAYIAGGGASKAAAPVSAPPLKLRVPLRPLQQHPQPKKQLHPRPERLCP